MDTEQFIQTLNKYYAHYHFVKGLFVCIYDMNFAVSRYWLPEYLDTIPNLVPEDRNEFLSAHYYYIGLDRNVPEDLDVLNTIDNMIGH